MTLGNPSQEGTEGPPSAPDMEDRRAFLIGLPDADGNIVGFAVAERVWYASMEDLRAGGVAGAATLSYLATLLGDSQIAPPAPVFMMKQMDDPNGPGVLGFRSLPKPQPDVNKGSPQNPPED